MKVIAKDADSASYRKVFKDLLEQKQKIVIWQVYDGNRTIAETLMTSLTSDQFNVLPPDQEFDLSLPVFFYAEEKQVIFKTMAISLTGSSLSVGLPAELKLLDEATEGPTFLNYKVQTFWSSRTSGPADRINDFVKVKSMKERSSRDQDFLTQEFDYARLDEEDKLYADKRESPRVRPKADKLVKIVRKGETKLHVMKLFDLSRGGLGFLTFSPDEFPKQTEIYITGFDAFELDDPLVGTIVAHRAVDDSGVEFKIGVKFNDGQE